MRQCIKAEKTSAHVYRLPRSSTKQSRARTEQEKNKIRTLTSLAYLCPQEAIFLPLHQGGVFLFTPAAGWCVFMYPCSGVMRFYLPLQ